jgi:hypothetical protein
MCRVWGCTHVIPVLGRWRQEDPSFKTSLGYILRSCLKKQGLEVMSVIEDLLTCDVKL